MNSTYRKHKFEQFQRIKGLAGHLLGPSTDITSSQLLQACKGSGNVGRMESACTLYHVLIWSIRAARGVGGFFKYNFWTGPG
jgi:hypothetical protein